MVWRVNHEEQPGTRELCFTLVWRVNHQEQAGTRKHIQGITFSHTFPLYLFRVNLGAFPECLGEGSRNGWCEARTGTGETGTVQVTWTALLSNGSLQIIKLILVSEVALIHWAGNWKTIPKLGPTDLQNHIPRHCMSVSLDQPEKPSSSVFNQLKDIAILYFLTRNKGQYETHTLFIVFLLQSISLVDASTMFNCITQLSWLYFVVKMENIMVLTTNF